MPEEAQTPKATTRLPTKFESVSQESALGAGKFSAFMSMMPSPAQTFQDKSIAALKPTLKQVVLTASLLTTSLAWAGTFRNL
jgi:hypothetical protein